MAEHENLRCEIVSVTPELAQHFRQSCNFERQRDIAPANVHRLATEMTRGRFIKGTPVLLAALPDGSLRILNGNHTLEAVAKSGETIPLVFIYHPVRDMNDAGRIYARLDLQRVRTWGDAFQAAGLGIPVTKQWLARLGGCLTLLLLNFGPKSSGGDERVTSRDIRIDAMNEYRNEVEILANSVAHAPRTNVSLIQRAAVLAVAIETVKYQPSLAVEFWSKLCADDGLIRTDPRKTLLEYLRKNKVSNISRGEQSIAAALAWNAWFQKRDLTILKPGAVDEIHIAGTPWNGSFDFIADLRKTTEATKIMAPKLRKAAIEIGTKTNADGSISKITMLATA